MTSAATTETVGYGRSFLTTNVNPGSSVSSVVEKEIVRRVEGLFALADQLELRLTNARGQVEQFTLLRVATLLV